MTTGLSDCWSVGMKKTPRARSMGLAPQAISISATSSLLYAIARCRPVAPGCENVVTVTYYLTSRPKYSSPSTLSKADLGKFLRRRRAILVWIGLSQMMRTWSKDSPEEKWLDVSAANWRKYQEILCTASSNRPRDPPKCALDHRLSSCSRRC